MSANSPQGAGAEERGGARWAWITAGAFSALCFFTLKHILGVGLVGHDTYPLIEGVVGRSAGELWTAKFLDGQLGMELHRPVQNSLLALEHAAFGLEPRGWQWVHLLDWTALVLSAFALAWRLLARLEPAGSPARRALLAALPALGFALHPLVEEIAPVVSRNHDPQALSLTFAGLWLAAGRRFGALQAVALAVICLLAAGIKETGYFVGPFAALLRFFAVEEHELVRRFVRVLRDTGLAALTVAGLLALRLSVLGGAGEGAKGLFHAPAMFAAWAKLLVPQPGLQDSAPQLLIAVLQLVALVALLWIGYAKLPAQRRPLLLGIVAVGAAWILLGGVLSGLAGDARSWRLLFPYAGFALLCIPALGPVAGHSLRATEAMLATALLAGVIARSAYAPLFAEYDQWQAGTERLHIFQERVLAGIDDAEIGDVLFEIGPPSFAKPEDTTRPHVQAPAILGTHSLRSYLALVRPNVPVRVTGLHGRLGKPRGVVQLALSSEFDSYAGLGRRFADALTLLTLEHPKAQRYIRFMREAKQDNDAKRAREMLLSGISAAGKTSAPYVRTILAYFRSIEDPVAVLAIERQLERWGVPIQGRQRPAPPAEPAP